MLRLTLRRDARRRLAVLLTGLALLALVPNLAARQLNGFFLMLPGIDKALHVLAYFAVFMCVHAGARRMQPNAHTSSWLAVLFGTCLSIGDELAQQLSPGRNVELLDLVADWAGLALGWVAVSPRRRSPATVAVAIVAALMAVAVTYETHVRLSDFSRALGYERQHDFVRARESYLRALAGGLQTPELYNGLGWVEIESGIGDPRKAVHYARIALQMQPDNADILDTYGWALHHAGRHTEALDYLQRAYLKKPEMFCIHYHLGSVQLALGDSRKAAFHFERQLEKAGTREAVFAARALEQLPSDR